MIQNVYKSYRLSKNLFQCSNTRSKDLCIDIDLVSTWRYCNGAIAGTQTEIIIGYGDSSVNNKFKKAKHLKKIKP